MLAESTGLPGDHVGQTTVGYRMPFPAREEWEEWEEWEAEWKAVWNVAKLRSHHDAIELTELTSRGSVGSVTLGPAGWAMVGSA